MNKTHGAFYITINLYDMTIKATLQHLQYERSNRGSSADNILWTMRDGNTIQVNRMSDQHLNNTIRMIERNTKRQEELNKLHMRQLVSNPVSSMRYFTDQNYRDYEDWYWSK